MTEPKQLLIRADAGGELGTGHVMRMLALAQAWQDRGGSVTLAACQCPTALIERLKSENIDFIQLGEHPLGGQIELAETIQLGKSLKSPWIVVDGYHFRENYHKALKEHGFKILAIDDYGHCESWHVDLILNQNVYAEEFAYPQLNAGTTVLRGPKYALLRREFLNQSSERKLDEFSSKHLKKLLLTFGGVDPDNVSGTVISALNALDNSKLSIRVIVGGGSPHRKSLEQLAAGSPHDIEYMSNVPDMPEQYAWADGIIGAGGTTCLEWLLFGLPAALVCVADNQRLVVSTLAQRNRCLDLGWHADLNTEVLASQLSSWIAGTMESTSFDSFKVDAFGSSRVSTKLDNGLRLRDACPNDCQTYFRWANDPVVRSNALNTTTILWEEHCRWFSSRLDSDRAILFVCIDENDRPIGQVRFEQKSPPDWEIDFSVEPSLRGRGLGFSMLSLALSSFRTKQSGPVLAIVKEYNTTSSKVFEKLGFSGTKKTETQLIFYRK
jgi:UDP-2,4-diacetamido-2,4,6-trideoxy-beta-L-altropyranose hydrolase